MSLQWRKYLPLSGSLLVGYIGVFTLFSMMNFSSELSLEVHLNAELENLVSYSINFCKITFERKFKPLKDRNYIAVFLFLICFFLWNGLWSTIIILFVASVINLIESKAKGKLKSYLQWVVLNMRKHKRIIIMILDIILLTILILIIGYGIWYFIKSVLMKLFIGHCLEKGRYYTYTGPKKWRERPSRWNMIKSWICSIFKKKGDPEDSQAEFRADMQARLKAQIEFEAHVAEIKRRQGIYKKIYFTPWYEKKKEQLKWFREGQKIEKETIIIKEEIKELNSMFEMIKQKAHVFHLRSKFSKFRIAYESARKGKNTALNTEEIWEKVVEKELKNKTQYLKVLQQRLSKATKKVAKHSRALPNIAKECRYFASRDRERRFREDEKFESQEFLYQVGAKPLSHFVGGWKMRLQQKFQLQNNYEVNKAFYEANKANKNFYKATEEVD